MATFAITVAYDGETLHELICPESLINTTDMLPLFKTLCHGVLYENDWTQVEYKVEKVNPDGTRTFLYAENAYGNPLSEKQFAKLLKEDAS